MCLSQVLVYLRLHCSAVSLSYPAIFIKGSVIACSCCGFISLFSRPAQRRNLSTHLLSTHLLSTHLLSTHLLSTHLLSTHLLSTHLLSTHLLSTHLLSTHLLSTHTHIHIQNMNQNDYKKERCHMSNLFQAWKMLKVL